MPNSALTTRMRAPMPLPQEDDYSCQSCVTSQVRWMLGLSDLTGQEAVREVDRLTGRKPHRGIPVTYSLPVLLDEGCEVVRYGPPDVDLGRLQREGLPYFREYHAAHDGWGDDEDAYWTPPRLAEYTARVADEVSVITAAQARYGDLLAQASEPFTIAVADRLLAGGHLIMTTYVEDCNGYGECHATLMYAADAGAYRLYTPSYEEDGAEKITRREFAGMLRPYAVGVRLTGV